jgi:hypothetical protein
MKDEIKSFKEAVQVKEDLEKQQAQMPPTEYNLLRLVDYLFTYILETKKSLRKDIDNNSSSGGW